jgi:VWFA-related protein
MFIRQSHWDHNLTAIMAIGRRGLTVIQDYTNDQAVLNQKLTEFRPGMTNSVEGVILQGQAEDHARQAVSGLLDIARASVGAPYNLNVIWITNGFGGAIREAKNSANGQNNGIRRLASMLTTARLRLYTINPSGSKLLEATAMATPMLSTHSGLYSGQSMSDASLEEDLASQSAVYEPDKLMQILTLMTGGRAFYGRNDIEVALKQAVSDGESNYALSYSPSNSDFKGEYRKIEVRTNVDGVHASTCRGYYAVDDDQNQSAALREERWSDALSGPLAYSAFSLTCPLTYNAESGEAKGTVTSRPTPMVIAGQQQTIQIVRAAALSSSGSILTAWSWQIDWKKTWTNRVSSVAFNKVVPRKSKAVRFVVSDPSGEHIGTCDYQLER